MIENLNICSEDILYKETAGAFSNSGLQERLKQYQMTEIEIVGIDGNSCIASTATDSVSYGDQTVLTRACIGVQNVKRFEKTKATLLERGIIIK